MTFPMRYLPIWLFAAGMATTVFAQPNLSPDGIHVIFGGDHPDPSIVRDGKDFYLTYTSHTNYPGLKIWHSTDLLNWEPVTYALHSDVGAVWAPEFIKHGDQFVIYFPTSRGENYVITAPHPSGPWTDPVKLDVSGIDPGHITDEAGNRFIYLNAGKFAELAPDGLSVTKDAVKKYDGWLIPDDWEIECMCLESPKLVRRDGYYYLTSAQGGTAGPATSHMVVVARATSPEGPWEENPDNPVIHTWSADEEFWSKGHGTVFDDAAGNSYVIYHAYQKGQLAMGRHMLIERVEWTDDGWYRTVRDKYTEGPVTWHPNEHVQSDDFGDGKIGLQWQFTGLRTPVSTIAEKGGALHLESSPETWRSAHVNPDEKSFEVAIEFEAESSDFDMAGGGMLAGLGMWYDEERYVGIGLREGMVALLRDGATRLAPDAPEGVRFLKIRFRDQVISMFWSVDGENWSKYGRSFEMSGYQHNVLGGFSYLRPAIFYRGAGDVKVFDFTYTPLSSMN